MGGCNTGGASTPGLLLALAALLAGRRPYRRNR
jgi:MYXO-CTERM domain-containing protein